ncbi:response regulator [Sinorhizobium medicae]|nr:response regulator [Sinorhizobium medicae]
MRLMDRQDVLDLPLVSIVDDGLALRRSHAPYEGGDDFLMRADQGTAGCPGINGLELQKQLPRTRSMLFIVFVTGHPSVRMRLQAMKQAACDCLPKPLENPQFVEAIERAIGLNAERRALASEHDRVMVKKPDLHQRNPAYQ